MRDLKRREHVSWGSLRFDKSETYVHRWRKQLKGGGVSIVSCVMKDYSPWNRTRTAMKRSDLANIDMVRSTESWTCVSRRGGHDRP